jgi:hypothetical protein
MTVKRGTREILHCKLHFPNAVKAGEDRYISMGALQHMVNAYHGVPLSCANSPKAKQKNLGKLKTIHGDEMTCGSFPN